MRDDPPFRPGQLVRVRPGNLGAGDVLAVAGCFWGLAGGWFVNLTDGACYAAGKLEPYP